MEEKELRIGNLVNYEQTTHYITSICSDYSKSKWIGEDEDFEYVHNYDVLEPIELNEEWLIKFGFSFDGIMFDINDKCRIGYYRSGFHLVNGYDLLDKIIEIKYVHKLQNLYYALTGIELAIK